jgi:hypothetical protein
MLSLVVAGLARQGTPSAWRAVVDHGLKERPALGETLERLGELGAFDLAEDPELVDRLVGVLRAQLPVRVLGLAIRRHESGPFHLVRALYSTRSEPVRVIFREIAERFPEAPLGQNAAAALAAWHAAPAPPPAPDASPASPAAPTAGLSGDLEVFGLPELLQTLAQSETSGQLVLRDRDGRQTAAVTLRKGLIRNARVRKLPMPEAFYELLERPQAGTFEFNRQPPEAIPEGPSHNVVGLLMEGMRRYDELQRARAVAPDDVFLAATGGRPTAPAHETDGALIRELWMRAKDGATPRQCEEALSTDAYRVRTLLAHWLTEGTLAARDAARNRRA